MTFQEFIASMGFRSGFSFWAVAAFLMSIGIEIIPKIKWNPWTTLIKWIGSRFNSKLDRKMDEVRGEIRELDLKIDMVQGELSKHISESEIKSLQDTRRDILEFCNACMNGRLHTREQFEFVIKQCDAYESHIMANKIKNGVIEAAIAEIRRLYAECLHKNSFLVTEFEQKKKEKEP